MEGQEGLQYWVEHCSNQGIFFMLNISFSTQSHLKSTAILHTKIHIPLQNQVYDIHVHLKGNTLQREPKLVGEVYARQSQIHQAEVSIFVIFCQSHSSLKKIKQR